MLTTLSFLLAVVVSKPETPPIAIEHCSFVQGTSFARGVRVVYKNTSKVAAKLVIFDVIQGGHTTEVLDQGTFEPGQTVDHVLTSAALTLWRGPAADRCSVVHVHFADGSVWGH